MSQRARGMDEKDNVAYQYAAGAVLAFLVIGVFVKYAELLLTPEHRALIEPQGTVVSRVAQIWLALRFSWHEFAIAATLSGVVLAARRIAPHPGRVARSLLTTLWIALGLVSLTGILSIPYYAVYHTQPSAADFAHIGWAREIAASADIFQFTSVRIGLMLLVASMIGFPLVWARVPGRSAARLAVLIFGASWAMAVLTWIAGRPPLSQARLEPNPTVWLLFGDRVAYDGLPPLDQLATIGERSRGHKPAQHARNVVLIVLESTPASALAGYNPTARAGRRLYAAYGDEITQFENVFAVSPNSVSSLLSILTGWSPVPNNTAALAASRTRPTLAEVLKSRGFQTHFLLSGPSDPLIDELIGRGFDRAWSMDDPWPGKERHSRITWGYDDRMLFEEAATFIANQTEDSPPFFLMLHASTPHHPYSSGMVPGLEEHSDARVRHERLVNHLMELVTTFYEQVRASPIGPSTAVLAYGDHGEAFGEHPGNYIHSKELYRENLHVPILLMHPTRLGLPPHIGQLGTLDDIMPSALDLLDVPAPAGSGMSLLFNAPSRTIFSMTDWGPGQVAFRNNHYFYSLSRTGREELYDIQADPQERRNIALARPDVVAGFRRRLTHTPPS